MTRRIKEYTVVLGRINPKPYRAYGRNEDQAISDAYSQVYAENRDYSADDVFVREVALFIEEDEEEGAEIE